MSETGKTTDSKFPVFRAGDSLGKVASHEHQNRIGQSIERLSQRVFGIGDAALVTGPIIFKKPRRRGTGGGGAEMIIFIIREADCELGTARGEVFRIMCTGATVSIGDMIDLEDPMGCFLTGPSDSLIGTKGAAVKMLSDAGSYDNCEWVITALCCVYTTCPE